MASELFNFFIATGFKDADLVSLRFVVSAGDAFDKVDGLTSVFVAKSASDSE